MSLADGVTVPSVGGPQGSCPMRKHRLPAVEATLGLNCSARVADRKNRSRVACFMPQTLRFLMATLIVHTLFAGEWPLRRGPENNGISTETTWVTAWKDGQPRTVWKAAVGVGFSSVTIAEHRAFTMGNTDGQETVHALNATNGAVLWTHKYPEPLNPKMYEGGPNSTPTVAGNRLFTISKTGKLFAFDAGSGHVLWTTNLASYAGNDNGQWGAAGSPLVMGTRIFINYGSALVALDTASGKPLWQTAKETKGKYSFSTPVLSTQTGSPLLLTHMQKALYAVKPEDGKIAWRHEFGRGYETHCSDPVLTPSGVFISSGDDGGELISFNGSAATRVWKNNNLGTFTGTAVALDGYLYGVDSGGYRKGAQEFRCIEISTGKTQWALPGFSQDSWIAAGGRILLLTEGGELAVVNARPDKGEIVARIQLLGGKCWSQPSLSDGLLYCRNARGDVYCFDLL